MLEFTPIAEHMARIKYENIFIGQIRINPRDAMVFIDIEETLPSDKIETILSTIKNYLFNDWGAKTILTLPPTYVDAAKKVGFNSTPMAGGSPLSNIIYFSLDNLAKAMADLSQQSGKSGNRQSNFRALEERFATGELKFIPEKKTEISSLSREIFVFLRDRGYFFTASGAKQSFITPQKIEQGLYSEVALLRRINNEIVIPFIIIDNNNNVKATMMVNVQNDHLAYVADVVIDIDERNKGLGEYFMLRVFRFMQEHHPEITAANIIAGGIGGEPLGQHIYIELLQGKNVTETAKTQPYVAFGNKAAFITFLKPGPLLLNAGNRSQDERSLSLDHTGKFKPIAWTRSDLELQQIKEATQSLTSSSSPGFHTPLLADANSSQQVSSQTSEAASAALPYNRK